MSDDSNQLDDVVIEDETSSDESTAKIKKQRSEIDTLKAERQEYLDGWQRSKADYVNAQKRFEADKLQALVLGKTVAVTAFIPVLDTLNRAKAHGELPAEFVGIEKQIQDAFKQFNVVAFGSVGDTFSPHIHEAIGQDEVERSKDNTITQVLEVGYQSGDQVLRPAKVRVGHSGGN